MNLTRIRQFDWFKWIIAVYNRYESNLKFHDQDILNIIFDKNPHKIYLLPCHTNFAYPFCPDIVGKCKSALEDEIVVVHGLGRSFTTNAAMKAINEAFNGVNFLLRVFLTM